MKKKANITIYREILEQIEAYEAGILKDAPKADVIYQITEANKDVNIRECKVTLVPFPSLKTDIEYGTTRM